MRIQIKTTNIAGGGRIVQHAHRQLRQWLRQLGAGTRRRIQQLRVVVGPHETRPDRHLACATVEIDGERRDLEAEHGSPAMAMQRLFTERLVPLARIASHPANAHSTERGTP